MILSAAVISYDYYQKEYQEVDLSEVEFPMEYEVEKMDNAQMPINILENDVACLRGSRNNKVNFFRLSPSQKEYNNLDQDDQNIELRKFPTSYAFAQDPYLKKLIVTLSRVPLN